MKDPEMIQLKTGGFAFQAYYYACEDPVANLVLVHGMGEYARRYERTVIPLLLEAKIQVYAYDQFGHGASSVKKGHNPGFEFLLDALAMVIGEAQEKGPKALFIYGHSMGGNVVLNYALRRKLECEGVIATSPFLGLSFQPPKLKLWAGKILARIKPDLTLDNELDTSSLSREAEEVKIYENDPMIHSKISTAYSLDIMETGRWAVDNAAELRSKTLVVHGTDDQITDPGMSERFCENSKGMAEFHPVKGGYHELHHDLDKVETLDFIKKWILKQI